MASDIAPPPAYAVGVAIRRPPATARMIAASEADPITSPPVIEVPPVNLRVIAEGLRLPEGPIAMDDGSVIVVECEGQALSRCLPDGRVEVIAYLGGGPNGAAIGPDGACYVCNNGGFRWETNADGLRLPADLGDYAHGSIQRVDLATGAVTTLYDSCDGHKLSSPNDLVFDGEGGFWFTDWGKPHPRHRAMGGVYYARIDGSLIREVVYPLNSPNGVALSPDGQTLYVSETFPRHLLHGAIEPGGRIATRAGGDIGVPALEILASPGGNTAFDSMKVEADGSLVIGTVDKGGLTRVTADGATIEHIPLPDTLTTNLSFGGPDRRTCFVTLSMRGQLVAIDWPRPGLAPAFHR